MSEWCGCIFPIFFISIPFKNRVKYKIIEIPFFLPSLLSFLSFFLSLPLTGGIASRIAADLGLGELLAEVILSLLSCVQDSFGDTTQHLFDR